MFFVVTWLVTIATTDIQEAVVARFATSWHQKSMEAWLEVGSGGQFLPSVWPHNPATGFWPPSTTVVSAEPFSNGTGTLRCLQKEMATYRHWSVSLLQDPEDISRCRILSPDKTEWQLIWATLCRWRRWFVADQLWFMKRIQEEEYYGNATLAGLTRHLLDRLQSVINAAACVIFSFSLHTSTTRVVMGRRCLSK